MEQAQCATPNTLCDDDHPLCQRNLRNNRNIYEQWLKKAMERIKMKNSRRMKKKNSSIQTGQQQISTVRWSELLLVLLLVLCESSMMEKVFVLLLFSHLRFIFVYFFLFAGFFSTKNFGRVTKRNYRTLCSMGYCFSHDHFMSIKGTKSHFMFSILISYWPFMVMHCPWINKR